MKLVKLLLIISVCVSTLITNQAHSRNLPLPGQFFVANLTAVVLVSALNRCDNGGCDYEDKRNCRYFRGDYEDRRFCSRGAESVNGLECVLVRHRDGYEEYMFRECD